MSLEELIRKFIKLTAYYLNIRFLKNTEYDVLVKSQNQLMKYTLADEVATNNRQEYFETLPLSCSQINQDLFVLSVLKFKRNGYFVEFGATDGKKLSNTYLLEKHYDWNGILAEPARIWHQNLEQNRKAVISTDCVWRSSNEKIQFTEIDNSAASAELSTISDYANSDTHASAHRNSKQYEVNTISLEDLLDQNNAPPIIDYLSIDTEGTEYEILSNFNFERYKFRVITCEHNYTALRQRIESLMERNGYKKFCKSIPSLTIGMF